MNTEEIELVKLLCEKIEQGTGHGQVVVKIQDGVVHLMQPTENILIPKLDNTMKK